MATYWPSAGKELTQPTLSLALKRARELGIKDVVLPSVTGYSASLLLKELSPEEEWNLVCVTHQAGFKEPGKMEMPEEVRRRLQEAGMKILTTTHLMGGLDRALRFAFQGVYPAEIIAYTLRLLGEGVKVGVEVAIMALDAGLIPYGREVVSLGGTREGLDTALVIQPAHSREFFATKIKEIICKPRDF
ncbi:MAG TPA: hypothetical protein ENM97_03030 [Moorella mulderi]|nr:hypothetical protein [Moorella mulderi]